MNKNFITFFVAVLMLFYIVSNWSNVSWIFSYREIGGLVHDFFNPYPESNLLASATASSDSGKASQIDNSLNNDYSAKYSLLAPSIGLYTPVVIAKSADKKALEDALDLGAVYYPGSVLPGENGQIVILGHSAPPNWPNVKHDWIFSHIENFKAGDKITLKYKNVDYTYSVVEKNIVQPGQSVSNIELSKDNNILTLISCWPPGKDFQRIIVTAKLL